MSDKYIGAQVEDFDGCTYTVVSYNSDTKLYLISGTKGGGSFYRHVSFNELSSYYLVSVLPFK